MGVDDDFSGIGATTFSLFRSRLVLNEQDQALFEATLAKAVEAGVLSGKLTVIIDSSPVHGAGAVGDTYDLVRGFLKKAVAAAGEALSRAAREVAAPHIGDKPDIDWHDKEGRRADLAELVSAAPRLLRGGRHRGWRRKGGRGALVPGRRPGHRRRRGRLRNPAIPDT
jgi:hypothetical protein